MTIKSRLDERGYNRDAIYYLAEKLVDDMIKNHPLPQGRTRREYMVMAAAATAASILSHVKPDGLEEDTEQNV